MLISAELPYPWTVLAAWPQAQDVLRQLARGQSVWISIRNQQQHENLLRSLLVLQRAGWITRDERITDLGEMMLNVVCDAGSFSIHTPFEHGSMAVVSAT